MSWELWTTLGWHAWVAVGVVALMLGALVFSSISADVVLVGSVVLLLVSGVVTPKEALAGMSNEGMITVGVLYVVVAGLDGTGGTALIVRYFLGRPRSAHEAIVKMMFPVALVSAFLNNTPVVAMFLPAVNDWAKKHAIAVSKLMIPLSYAAILGGVCTLIGTSTNIVVNGLLISAKGADHALGMFDITWAGLPVAVGGILFILLLNRWLLPDRRPTIRDSADPRQYTAEMIVDPDGPLVGCTIEGAGLRHLPKMFLMEIERAGEILPAVPPEEKLRAGDRLVFVGIADSVVDLQRIRGLTPAAEQIFKLDLPRSERCLIEAVVSDRCPLVGRTIRDGRFRSTYNAAIIAVGRSGGRIDRKIGDIVLRPGDTLLLEARRSFAEQQRNSRDFYLVSAMDNSAPPRHERAIVAVLILLALIVVASLEWMSMLEASLLAAGAMIITRCCTGRDARRSVEWPVLIAIAASFGIGTALEKTGVAKAVAYSFIDLAGASPWASLVVIYGVALLLTELLSNNSAAVLMFPIVMQTADRLGVSYMPFVIALCVAASCGFAMPLGYQTHLMVYGPGGYRLSDFLRIGIPLDLLCWAIAAAVIPLVFPFSASP